MPPCRCYYRISNAGPHEPDRLKLGMPCNQLIEALDQGEAGPCHVTSLNAWVY